MAEQQVSTNKFSCAKWIVDTNGVSAGATHSTIAAALTSASSGDTIFVKPGTYTENLTLKAGVNISAFDCDAMIDTGAVGGNVIIKGKTSASFVGRVGLSGLVFETNGDYAISLTGANATGLSLTNCKIWLTDANGIEIANSATAKLTLYGCTLNSFTTGITAFDHSGTAAFKVFNSNLQNNSASTTASTLSGTSAGLDMYNSYLSWPITTSNSAVFSLQNCESAKPLTCGGTGAHSIKLSTLLGGSNPALTVNGSCDIDVNNCVISSSNDFAIDGSGTINYGGLTFKGGAENISTTTQVLFPVSHVPHFDVVHTAAEADDHALEIDCDAAGFGDVKALDIVYITGATTGVQDEEAILLNFDESASTGGIINGYEVLTTAEGTATINGYTTGINVNPIVHESGTFGDADDILNKAVDVTAALASGGAGTISIFVADNDTFTIGDAATWDEFEIILGTGASGAGVAPTFEYSTGGAAYSAFSPADGTNGFRNTGAILWDSSALTGWATATSGRFEIRITRTRNTLSTTPIIDELQISSTTEYTWDKNGDVSINSLTLATPLTVSNGGTGVSTQTNITFTQSPLGDVNAGSGGGNTNLIGFQEGEIMEMFLIGAKTILYPTMDTTGELVSLDLTDNEGCEYNWGPRANAKNVFTIGTSAAFFVEWKFTLADVTGCDPVMMGFRKVEANNVTFASYTDFATIGVSETDNSALISLKTNLNSGGVVTTNTTDAWTDGQTHTLRVLVSAAGVVTYTIDGSAPTATAAFTFDNTDVVMPFFHGLHGTTTPGTWHWQQVICGLQ